MMKLSEKNKSILIIFAWCIVLPASGSLISALFFKNVLIPQEQVHFIVEMTGALIALFTVGLLLSHKYEFNFLTNYRVPWIVCGLMTMGILDGFHAIAHVGNNFVWLHSLATFLGGVLFAGVIFDRNFNFKAVTYFWVALCTCLMGVLSLAFPEYVPNMLQEKQFTFFARLLNIVGGLAFIAAALRLVIKINKANKKQITAIVSHCALFGMAGILFELSSVWDVAWWWWHVLRLGAYFALIFLYLEQISLSNETKLNFEESDPKKNLLMVMLPLAIVLSVTVTVIVAWLTKNNTLVTVFPNASPMQYNTALCFIFCVIGFVFLLRKNQKISLFFSGGVMVFSGLTFLQYVFLVDFKIDNIFFVAPNNMPLVSDPGRMSPVTSVAFILSAVILIFNRQRKIFLACVFSLMMICLAALSVHTFGLRSLYGIASFSRMAIHTSICFLLLVIAYYGYFFRREKYAFDFWKTSPYIVAVACFAVTTLAWENIRQVVGTQNQKYFDSLVEEKTSQVLKRFALYEQALLGGVGFIQGSSYVSREEWRKYTQALRIDKYIPGSNGIGLIDSIQSNQLQAYQNKVKRNDFKAFQVYPKTKHKDKFVIRFIEPIEINLPAVGLDIGFEKNRRKAAELARDKGEIHLTEKILLVQDEKKMAGFLLLAPLYTKSSVFLKTAKERRENFIGWVYSPFTARNFFADIVDAKDDKISLSIYEHIEDNAEALIYSNTETLGSNSKFSNLDKTQTIKLGHRDWILYWKPSKHFIGKVDTGLPILVLVVGTIASILLIGMFFLLSQLYGKSAKIADESRMQLKSLFDQAIDCILIFDMQGLVLSINKAGKEMFEIRSKGQNEELSIYDYIPQLYPYVDKLLREQNQIKKNFELEGVTVNQHVFPIEGAISPMKIRDSVFFSLILRDITGRKKIDTLKNEFISTVNHELRTPLTAITGSLSIIKMKLKNKVDDKIFNLIELSSRNSKKLVNLVNDLLDTEKIAAGKMEYDLQYYDLNELTQKVVEDNQGFALEHNIKLIYQNNNLPVKVKVDSLRYQQAATNLISNAVKFSPKGEKVKVMVYTEDSYALLCVEDKGPGIPKGYADKIFDKFSQVDSSSKRKEGGTGLGLNITQSIILAFGGKVYYDTILNEGSKFYIKLPLADQDKK